MVRVMALPQQVAGEVTRRFLVEHLPPPPARVLDVGCGSGVVARMLDEAGYELVALDASLKAVTTARAEGLDVRQCDWMEFHDARPYDVVLFLRVLHSVRDLNEAIRQACQYLAPRGRILVEDFASEIDDVPTFEWFRTAALLLSRAGVLRAPSRGLLERILSAQDGARAWSEHHDAHLPIHSSVAIAESLRNLVRVTSSGDAPHLFRYFAPALTTDDKGGALLTEVLEAEARAVAVLMIQPVGRRFVAELRSPEQNSKRRE
jgi:SAM-dependent methyltransferase